MLFLVTLKQAFKTNRFCKQDIHLFIMNFGSVSPSGIQLLTSPITIRGKNGSKLSITGLKDSSKSKRGTEQATPLIYGNQKPKHQKSLDLETFDSNSQSDCQQQPNRQFETNENINQDYSRHNNRNWNEASSCNKSRVPEIQMINKYYGLIPKKFTMHSRHSADRNQR